MDKSDKSSPILCKMARYNQKIILGAFNLKNIIIVLHIKEWAVSTSLCRFLELFHRYFNQF